MRRQRLLGALVGLGLLAAGTALWAQSPFGGPIAGSNPSATTIAASQADVYSGPATTFYATGRLRSGDRVVVLGESKKNPGWLEILPPAGSFSWIDARYVKVVTGIDKIGIVDAGDARGTVPVLPGSNVVNREPNVEIARVATGTQVILLDRPMTGNGSNWYPIAPVASEVRFIMSDALRGGTYASNNSYGNSYGAPTYPTSGNSGYPNSGYPNSGYSNTGYPTSGYSPNYGTPNPASPYPGYPTANPTPMPTQNSTTFVQISQAGDQALQAGNSDRARQLYLEALNQTNDAAWRTYLQGQLAKIAPPSGWSPASNTPAYPTPTYPTNGGTPYIPTSNPAGYPNDPLAGNPAAPGIGQKQWSPWGVLRSTSFTTREGQPMFVLENKDSRSTVLYITTQPGTSLREYLGQTVALYGTMGYRSDEYIRMQYLIAEQVATPPGPNMPQ